MVEAIYSCIGMPTGVGQEHTPQVGSFLPIDRNPISDRHTPNTRIGDTNSIISFRVKIT